MVRAVEDGLVRMSRQCALEVHLALGQQSRLVPAPCPGGELALPDLRRRGDQPQDHVGVGLPRQTVHIAEIFVHGSFCRCLHLGDQGGTAEVDAVEFPLAQQLLHAGFQAGPAVPQGKLVREVFLHSFGITAAHQSSPGELRHLGQGTVFRFGLGPVRQKNMPHQQSRQEQAEKRRQKAAVCFCHDAASFKI